jgi:serine/threonine-protein kinase HipA
MGVSDDMLVLIGDDEVAMLGRRSDGVLTLAYLPDYASRSDATPLSRSLPLTVLHQQSGNVESFFRGLLPENPELLAGLAFDAGTSTRDVLGLLAHVGEDLPGAVRVRYQGHPPTGDGGVEWISLDEVASRLNSLTNSQSRIRREYPHGRWSLAGAQAKLALRFEDGRWGIPWGVEPTTHILKPAIPGFGDFDLHEAVVTRGARLLGMSAAGSSLLALPDGSHAFVAERYDRDLDGAGRIVRVHQEDLCQALGVPAWQKYEQQGGPGVTRIGGLLASLSPEAAAFSTQRFFDALAFNYAIGGTDAHARNYSILLSAGASTLAPLYDLNSALPFTRPDGVRFAGLSKLHSAMRIGSTDAFTRMGEADWTACAQGLGLDPGMALDRLRLILGEVSMALTTAAKVITMESEVEPTVDWEDLLGKYHQSLRIKAVH